MQNGPFRMLQPYPGLVPLPSLYQEAYQQAMDLQRLQGPALMVSWPAPLACCTADQECSTALSRPAELVPSWPCICMRHSRGSIPAASWRKQPPRPAAHAADPVLCMQVSQLLLSNSSSSSSSSNQEHLQGQQGVACHLLMPWQPSGSRTPTMHRVCERDSEQQQQQSSSSRGSSRESRGQQGRGKCACTSSASTCALRCSWLCWAASSTRCVCGSLRLDESE